jgi:ubiquitin carboxyl-terminal hydrolase 48
MSHLATEFEKQAVPSLKTLLSDQVWFLRPYCHNATLTGDITTFQFEGKLTYGTMCQECRQSSERDANFLELEINLEV